MKRTFLSLVAVLMVANVFAIDLKQQIQELRTLLLKTPGVTAVEVGENDKVELNYKTDYFYFTVNYAGKTSLTKGLEVTLNAKSFKIPEGKLKVEDLHAVALKTNQKFHSVKVNIDEKNQRVIFQEEFYVKDVSSLSTDILGYYLSTITKARNAYADSIKNVKQIVPPTSADTAKTKKPGSTKVVIPRDSISELQLGTIVCQGVDAHGKKVLDANQFTKDNLKYVNFVVDLTGPKVNSYTLSYKIISPKKQLMLNYENAKYTCSTLINIKKKDKEDQFTTVSFGSIKKKIWESGQYTVFFYEGDNYLGEYKFTVR